jgi:DNA repair protein RadD
MQIELRDYQKEHVIKVVDNFKIYNNVILQLPTGGGKTVILTHILSKHEGGALVVAHRSELVSQISLALAHAGIRHNLITSKETLRQIITVHFQTYKTSYFDDQADISVGSVDTLVKLDEWAFRNVKLLVFDEGHHVLRTNKWGKVHAKCVADVKTLMLTATPERADGKGLGAQADGIADVIVRGPQMRELIDRKYLADYRIIAPKLDVSFDDIAVTAAGDFSAKPLYARVRESRIVGDVVANYLKFANGQLGITFAASIESATRICDEYNAQGVRAALITGTTPPVLRAQLMKEFKAKQIMQLVNVDILGEGVDVPAVGVVSFARPTRSYALYCQQFGRALRTAAGKTHAIIIDHVDNVRRLNLPDRPRAWALEGKRRGKTEEYRAPLPLATCTNIECLGVYERIFTTCPYCNTKYVYASRKSPGEVDGDLLELDINVLEQLRAERKRLDSDVRIPTYLNKPAQLALQKHHKIRQLTQQRLRRAIAAWAAIQKSQGASDAQIYRLFYFNYGIDILTAQTLNTKQAECLHIRLKNSDSV